MNHTLRATDPDDTVFQYVIVTLPSKGKLYVGADRELVTQVPHSIGTFAETALVDYEPVQYEWGVPYSSFNGLVMILND